MAVAVDRWVHHHHITFLVLMKSFTAVSQSVSENTYLKYGASCVQCTIPHASFDMLNEEERAPCLGGAGGAGGGSCGDTPDGDSGDAMLGSGARRRVALDALFVCWGLGTWLGVNGLYVQLPLLVERLPEGWALPASMALAVQLANIGLLVYAALRRLRPRASDSPYICALLGIGTTALIINAFVYSRTTPLAGSQRSLAFLALTFFAALVGCTSSVLFYPYLRHFRDVYLATYLVGEGLSGFVPSVLALVQGVGGSRPARTFDSERVAPAVAAKDEEATDPRVALFRGRWLGVLALMLSLNALSNGVLPSVQSYSCMPYGSRAYHLAATLGAMANPAACLAGVWLRAVPARVLAAMLSATALPLAYILATALLSPAPPLQHQPIGVAIIVISWIWVSGVVSYARMWVYGWARAGGARGMRAVGGATQLGSAAGSLLLFGLVNYTHLFTQADQLGSCETARELHATATGAGLRVRFFAQRSVLPELPPAAVPREGVLLDLQCPHAGAVLNQASSSRAFNFRYTWLLLHNSSFNSSLDDLLMETEILPDADVTLVLDDVLFDVYRIKKDQPLILTDWGLTTNVSLAGLEEFWAKQPTAVARRKDLRNVRLKCEVIVSQPQYFKGWSDLTQRQIDTYPKLTYPLMMLVADDLHFRYSMRQVDLYGEEHNGSFNGLAGSLQRGEVDIGAASLFMRGDRWRILHYVAETLELRGAFMFRQPVQAAVTNVFLLPFSRGVWAATVIISAGAALLLAVLSRVCAFMDPDLKHITPAETFTFAIGTICQQGCKCFAVVAPSNALRTIDDLVHSSIGVGVQETTYKKVYFAESNDPATRRLYRKKLLPLGDRAYLSVSDGIERMRTEFFAFQVEEGSGYDVISKTFTEHEKCGLMQIQAFKLPMVSIPVKKYSGYRELFAVRFRWQREIGLMEQVRRVWMQPKPRCDAGAGGFTAVTMEDLLPCVEILLMGSIISAMILAAECIVHKYKQRKVRDHGIHQKNSMRFMKNFTRRS
ncbi:glutamate receptor 1-like [Phthorimaea operculella]|nr:glutamate receptor 1-like [Phthorimaea operculella]